MIVSTFNIQNDYKRYKDNKSKTIYNYIINNKIDIIGLQELPKMYYKELKQLLNNYLIVGKYRNKIKFILPKGNEMNPIITKYPVIDYKTYYLPSFPSKYKRILTWVLIKYNNEEISIYNTHLEINNNKIKEKQINKIINILIKDKRKKILMGDFNMQKDDILFSTLINNLSNMKRIIIDNFTYKNKTIDHILISKDLNYKNNHIIKDLNISDHYPLITEIY